MRIKAFRIKNYRSILDSGEVNLDSKITTLMGKNESGKTCILKALESFRSDYEYSKDDFSLHSKVRERIEGDEIDKKNMDMVTIWFEIESEDESRLTEIKPSLKRIKTLKVNKYFENSYKVEIPEISWRDLEDHEKKEIDENFSSIEAITNSFRNILHTHTQRHESFLDSRPEYEDVLEGIIVYIFDSQRDQAIDKVFDGFYERLKKLPNRDAEIDRDIKTFVKEIEYHKEKIKTLLLPNEHIRGRLLEILPNFMYFADVDRVEDSLPIPEFLAKRSNHKTLSNLIELSGLDVERVKDAGDYDMITSLRSASTTVTGLVNHSWKQEKLAVGIGIVRDKIVVSISDNTIKKDHPPSIRSHGFQWFLSFYINFAVGSRGEFRNTIILLDDLGVYLHPSGQKDLLRTLEIIADSNQIVFSTHSPFMVNKDKLERIRIVSKRDEKGTIMREKYRK